MLWSVAAYGTGAFLHWIDKEVISSRLEKEFAITKHNVVKNLGTHLKNEPIVRNWKGNNDDVASDIIAWMDEKERGLRDGESAIANNDRANSQDLQFWKHADRPEFLGISVFTYRDGIRLTLISIDVDRLRVSTTNFPVGDSTKARVGSWSWESLMTDSPLSWLMV